MQNTIIRIALVASVLIGADLSAGTTDPSVPVGSLRANPTIVQVGALPVLDWSIQYPKKAIDVLDIQASGQITPKVDLYMDIRVLGAAFQTAPGQWKPVQASVQADGAKTWTQIFYDTQPNVIPTQVYYTKLARKNRTNNFGAKYYSGGWGPFYSTNSANQNVLALVNGDTPPSYAPAFQEGDIKAFLKPYLAPDGRILIGPMDVILLFELDSTTPGSTGFDMQDLVLLVTFRTVAA